MQNLLVIIFPQIIDAINSAIQTKSSRVKFWVAIIVSLVGGIALNWQMVSSSLASQNAYSVGTVFTLLLLIITAAQGVYLKYWEHHPVRASVFPSVVAPKN